MTAVAPGQSGRRSQSQKKNKKSYNKNSPYVDSAKRFASSMTTNEILSAFFAFILFVTSMGLNVFNVYDSFAPATSARFVAVGLLDFIFMMPGFSFLAIVFRVLIASLLVFTVLAKKKDRFNLNPAWWIYLFIMGYCLFVGLSTVITTIPFLIALAIVGGLQWTEIIFWSARDKDGDWSISAPHPMLWLVVVIAYTIEATLQYAALPVHPDYQTLWGLVVAMGTNFNFDWGAFSLIQIVIAVIGLLGIEIGAVMIQLIQKHG